MCKPASSNFVSSDCETLRLTVWLVFLLLLGLPLDTFAYEEQIDSLAEELLLEIEKDDDRTIAVVDFSDLRGDITDLGRFLAEELSTVLAEKASRVQVVDRMHLNRIIQEQKLGTTGLLDPETVRQVGQFAGVDLLVTGTLTPFGESIRVAVKILGVETAKVVGASRVNLPKTKAIADLQDSKVAGVGQDDKAPGTEPVEAASQAGRRKIDKPLQVQEGAQFRFELQGCSIGGTTLTCILQVTNQGADVRLQVFGGGDSETKVFDNQGDEYIASTVKLGDAYAARRRLGVSKTLLSRIPVELKITFEGLNPEAKSIALLQVATAGGERGRFVFRDVAVEL